MRHKNDGTTKIFAKAGLDIVTSATCKHQQQPRLDVQFSALILNINNIYLISRLYRAGQAMNFLPSQTKERCTVLFWEPISFGKIQELGNSPIAIGWKSAC